MRRLPLLLPRPPRLRSVVAHRYGPVVRTLEDVLDQFAYHPATRDTAPKHALVRDLFASMAEQLWDVIPPGPEKTLVFRELQQAQMFANLAVALTAPADVSSTRSFARVLPLDSMPDRG